MVVGISLFLVAVCGLVGKLFLPFSLNTMKREALTPKGAGMFRRPNYEALKGYYDPEHNVFVISAQGIWVYRYGKK